MPTTKRLLIRVSLAVGSLTLLGVSVLLGHDFTKCSRYSTKQECHACCVDVKQEAFQECQALDRGAKQRCLDSAQDRFQGCIEECKDKDN